MKKMVKSAVVALALALSLSFGVSTTANAKVTVKKVVSVNKLTGSKNITLTKGKKATLKTTVTVTPNKAANKKVTYKSSKKSVATVTKKGVIKASKKKTGTAKITVASKKNKKKKATVTVKVVAGKVTKVTFDKTSLELTAGATDTIKATVKTKGKKANKALVWASSDATVAKVDAKGVVTAVAPGTATITATSTDGTNKKATATVKVTSTTLALGTADVVATVELSDASKAAADFKSLVAAAGLKDDSKIVVTINDRMAARTKTVKEVNAYLAKTPSKTTVKFTVKNADAKAYGLAGTLFAPASVKSVTVKGAKGNVKFEKITASTFTVGTKTYTYKVDGKNIVVDGHVAADFKELVDAKVVVATEN